MYNENFKEKINKAWETLEKFSQYENKIEDTLNKKKNNLKDVYSANYINRKGYLIDYENSFNYDIILNKIKMILLIEQHIKKLNKIKKEYDIFINDIDSLKNDKNLYDNKYLDRLNKSIINYNNYLENSYKKNVFRKKISKFLY